MAAGSKVVTAAWNSLHSSSLEITAFRPSYVPELRAVEYRGMIFSCRAGGKRGGLYAVHDTTERCLAALSRERNHGVLRTRSHESG